MEFCQNDKIKTINYEKMFDSKCPHCESTFSRTASDKKNLKRCPMCKLELPKKYAKESPLDKKG